MDEIEVRKPTSFRPPWITDYVIDTSVTVPFQMQGNHSAVGLYVGDQEYVRTFMLTSGAVWLGLVPSPAHRRMDPLRLSGRYMLACLVPVQRDWPILILCDVCYGMM